MSKICKECQGELYMVDIEYSLANGIKYVTYCCKDCNRVIFKNPEEITSSEIEKVLNETEITTTEQPIAEETFEEEYEEDEGYKIDHNSYDLLGSISKGLEYTDCDKYIYVNGDGEETCVYDTNVYSHDDEDDFYDPDDEIINR